MSIQNNTQEHMIYGHARRLTRCYVNLLHNYRKRITSDCRTSTNEHGVHVTKRLHYILAVMIDRHTYDYSESLLIKRRGTQPTVMDKSLYSKNIFDK